MPAFTIGRVAKQAGVKIDTLRFYERQGLVPEPSRTASNYRVYPEDTARGVRFVKRAQDLGFSLREIKGLLKLRATPGTPCEDVRRQALNKIEEIDDKIRSLRAMKAALAKLADECATTQGSVARLPDLGFSQYEWKEVNVMKDKALATASVVSAVLASLCCIGLLVAVGLGLGAFSAATFFESLRPYLLIATGALLAGAFYLTYRKQPEERCEGEACSVGPDQKSKKVLLWVITAAVGAFAAFPYYSSVFWGGGATASASTTAVGELQSAVFAVEGMTCAGCAATLENALKNTPGVRSATVDLEGKSANVTYDPSQTTTGRLLTVMDENRFSGAPRADRAAKPEGIVYNVEGMTCNSCALGIQATLSRRKGVKQIEVLYDDKTARVAFDPTEISSEQLAEAFEELGYKVSPKSGS